MKMNLEQTVQYLLDATGNGVRIEAFFTDPNNISPSAETFGKYYIVTIDEVRHLFVVTKNPELGEEVYDKFDLGEWPKPGAQGVPGPQGQAPVIKISPAGTWVINGIDTKKPSRGIKGEQGPAGVGRPGLGVTAMLAINGEDYSPDVTKLDDGYELYTTMADIEYDAGDSTQTLPVEFKYLVKTNVFAEQAEVTPTAIHFTKNIAVDGSVNTNQVMVPSFGNIKSPSTNLDTQLRSKMPIPVNSPLYNYSFVYGTGGTWTTNNTHVMQGIAGGTNANTVMMRDSFGRAAVAAPHSNTDIANKKYVDDAVAGASSGATVIECTSVYDNNAYGEVPTPTMEQCQQIINLYEAGKVVYLKWESSNNYGTVIEADYGDTFTLAIYGAKFVTYTYTPSGEISRYVRSALSREEIPSATPIYKHQIRLARNAGETDTPATIYLVFTCYRSTAIRSVAQMISGLVTGYINLYCMRYTDSGPIEQSIVLPSWVEANNTLRLRYYLPGNEYLNVLPIHKYTWAADTITQM